MPAQVITMVNIYITYEFKITCNLMGEDDLPKFNTKH